MRTVGKLERVSLRQVWPNEAYDFTCFLQENPEVLGEAIGLELNSVEREQSAGSFSVDLLAEDGDGHVVIIENQLERSDHDHLGKVLTYMVAMDASTAVWIVADPRPEHVAVIQWLNESTEGSFYMVKVEAVRIGDSALAALFTEIVGPSEEAREVGETKRELAEGEKLRKDYWTSFLKRAGQHTQLFSNVSPSTDSWVSTGAGMSGFAISAVMGQHQGRADLYIDRGTNSMDENKAIFDWLYARIQEIEAASGIPLVWERLDGRRACRISIHVDAGGYRDNNWEVSQVALIETVIQLERGLRPYLDQLRSSGLSVLSS